MNKNFTRYAFTGSVKKAQERYGTRNAKVEAFDWNCPRHITPRYSVEEIQSLAPVD